MTWTPFTVDACLASPRAARRLRLLAGVAAALPVVIGAAVLFGWAFRVPWLIQPIMSFPPMVASAAVMLLLAGLALGCSLGASPGLRWAGRGLAAASAVVALATLAHHQAVPACVAMLLADAAIMVLDLPLRPVPAPSETLALAAAIMSWLALGSYLYGTAQSYAWRTLAHPSGMSVHGAVAILALAVGIAVSRPDRGAMTTLASAHMGGQAARRMLAVALSIPVLGYFATWAQRAGLYRAPGAVVVAGAGGMVVAIAIALAVGRSLDRTDLERRRREHETREWKRFFDRATFGAVIATRDERLGIVNEAFARMHGYTVAELEGRPAGDLFPPERQGELVEKVRTIDERGHCRWESEHVRKDGSVFPVFVDVTAVRDDEGRLLYRAAYVQDITDEKNAEAARARLASLVESSDDVITAEALDGTVLDWNHAAERVFGYSAREMVGRSICAIIPQELREERCALRAQALAGETVVGFETQRVRKDGRRIPIALTLSPIRDPVGRVVGLSTIERDISTLKRLQREREEWSAVVAHDLRQPASAIRLSAENLARSETDPARQRVIERMRKASDRLERMICDLLDVSRIESGQLAVRIDVVELRPLVADVVALLPAIQGRCRVDVDPEAESATVDAERFVQVLSNLLTNALKYGEPDTPVEVCVEPTDGMVRVSVTNEGPGISQEEIPRLFSRFARTPAAQSGKAPGLGLGLYICRGIVEAHGGRLWVESVPGEKTHFRFTVPSAPRRERALPRARQVARP